MGDLHEVDNLVDSVRNGIGLDVYAFYEGADTKRLVSEAVITTIVTGLVLEYLKGLLRPKQAGQASATRLRAFVTEIRGERELNLEALQRSLGEHVQQAKRLPRGERLRSVPAFVAELVDGGVPVQTATAIADVVSGEVAHL